MIDIDKITFGKSRTYMSSGNQIGCQDISYDGILLKDVELYTYVPWSPFKDIVEKVFIHFPIKNVKGETYKGHEILDVCDNADIGSIAFDIDKETDYVKAIGFYFKNKDILQRV